MLGTPIWPDMWVWGPRLKNLVPSLLFVYFLSTEIFYPRSTSHGWVLDTCAGSLSKILTARRKIVGTSGEWAPTRQQPCCIKLFSKYLAYELLNSPVSWQDFSCIHILSLLRFWTFCTECFAFYHFDCVTVKTNYWFSFINLTSTSRFTPPYHYLLLPTPPLLSAHSPNFELLLVLAAKLEHFH